MSNSAPIITLHNATLRLGKRLLWKDLQLELRAGEFLAVLGPNGAGKSSLLKVLLGVQQLSNGTATVHGQPPRRGHQAVGYVPQQKAFDRDIPMRGRDLVQLGVDGTRWEFLRGRHDDAVQKAITEVGASKFADKPLGLLSGGEQQRLRIAQALVSNPDVLLCDEPLLSLDVASQQKVAHLIDARCQQGTAVVLVTHEINPILPLVDRVLYIVGGKWAIGTPDEVLTSERLSELYGAHVDVLRVHGRVFVVSTGETGAAEVSDAHHHIDAHEEEAA